MHRTEGANNLANLFTEGPPATTVTEEWLNAIQEELAYVIEQAGLTLKTAATDTRTQLRSALLQTVPMPRGYIDGLIMSNGTDANHDIDIAVGKCRDSGDAESILFNTAMTKQIDANWAEGTNQGGFPSGLGLAVDTWYHVFIIMSADGTKVDAGFDTSLTAVNLLGDATDYSIYRRIGSVLTDGASDITPFFQTGDLFEWYDPPLDYNQATGVNINTVTLSTPLGIKVMAKFNFNTTSSGYVYFKATNVLDEAAVNNAAPSMTIGTGAATTLGEQIDIKTDVSSQITLRSTANVTCYLATVSWLDPRGKDA